jgi:hypothetical protein
MKPLLSLETIQEISMKTKFALGAVVAAVAVFSQTAFAQTAASAPVDRQQRKAETAEANKSGKLTPAGEGNISPAPAKTSDKTRDQRKAQTQADAKSGALAPAGEGKSGTTQPSTASDKTRAERKAQTEADRKAGKLAPAGDAAAQK